MSGIKISKAVYGTGSTTVDVTNAVTSSIKDGEIYLSVTPDSLGISDPAPGQQKTLEVTYSINGGSTMGQMVKDNGVLMISAPPERRATGLQIIKAEYGYTGNYTDVTDAIQAQVKDGSIKLTVGHKAVGIPDPNPNKLKTLDVQYEINGAPNSVQLTDGKVLNISAPPVDDSDTKTPSQHAMGLTKSLIWGIYIFIITIAWISSARVLGIYVGEQYFWIAFMVGIAFPGISFWGLGTWVFFRRLFSDVDIVTYSLPDNGIQGVKEWMLR